MKESFLFLADGFEEIEALTMVDVLRRAGIPVKTVSITSSLQVVGAHGITVSADYIFDNTLFVDAPWLILPGGLPGAENLYEFSPLQGLLKNQVDSEYGRVAAICAAPGVVLGRLGLLKGNKATCYPGFESDFHGAEYVDTRVVVSGKFVTANGPSSALQWALEVVRETLGADLAREVATGMLLYQRDPKEVDSYFG